MSTATPPAWQDAIDKWNERYRGEDFRFGTAPNGWLAEHAGLWHPGQRVLCVADGEGRNSVALARQGLRVDAFDVADVGVAKARRFAAEQGVEVAFSVNDVEDFAWAEDAYDGVAAIFIQFADPPMRDRLFGRMRRCLRPGGLVVLQGYTPRQLEYGTGGPPQVSHLYTEAMLREAFAGFEIVALREYEAELAEGTGHRGRSALVGMVARRPDLPSARRTG